ncbi:hypothetical protein PC116_g17194 [Phytophthora cactorum]|nr:hypothetical protein PC116_g17194 [Phytophthora cactorum]
MPKRKYQASPIQATKPTSVCDYCEKEFTTRGMTSHLKKCIKKRAHDIATAEKTRTYNFSILNESVHEIWVTVRHEKAIILGIPKNELTWETLLTGLLYQVVSIATDTSNMRPSDVAMGLTHHTERTHTQGGAAHHVRYGRQNNLTCEEEDRAALEVDRLHHNVLGTYQ